MGVLLLLLLLRVALLPPVSVAAAALPPSLCAMHIRMHARWSAYWRAQHRVRTGAAASASTTWSGCCCPRRFPTPASASPPPLLRARLPPPQPRGSTSTAATCYTTDAVAELRSFTRRAKKFVTSNPGESMVDLGAGVDAAAPDARVVRGWLFICAVSSIFESINQFAFRMRCMHRFNILPIFER